MTPRRSSRSDQLTKYRHGTVREDEAETFNVSNVGRSFGGLLQFRQANHTGVPFAQTTSSRYLPGRSAGEGKHAR